MAARPRLPTKPVAGPAASAKPPVDHSHSLDQLPQPEVIEKDTDSVWALWSDVVNEKPAPGAETQPASLETQPAGLETQPADLETAPGDFDGQLSTVLMDLPEMPKDDQ